MTVKQLIDAFCNWNLNLKINNNNLDTIAYGGFWEVKDIFPNEEVVSFGIFNNDFCIRINK